MRSQSRTKVSKVTSYKKIFISARTYLKESGRAEFLSDELQAVKNFMNILKITVDLIYEVALLVSVADFSF